MSGLLTLASGSGSNSSSSAVRYAVAAVVSTSATPSLSTPSSNKPRRSFSTSSRSQAHANSKQSQRKRDATLRSAIELYHLAPSFFPTPAQTAGFGAAAAEAAADVSSSAASVTSPPPRGEEEAHSVALDSAIRASIQTLITAEQQAAMDVIRAGSYQYSNVENDSDAAVVPSYKPVEALRVVDLLSEIGEGSNSDRRNAPLAGGTAATDGRGVGGPVYQPGRSAPISSIMGDPSTLSAASQRDFVRGGPDAERSLDAAFSPQSGEAKRAGAQTMRTEDTTSIRRELRFIKPRQPSPRQGALRELYEVRNQYEAAVKALDIQGRKYMDPFIDHRGPAPPPPSSVPKPRFLENIPHNDESGRSGAETRPRVTSAIAETDRLDARAARIRDALFGTVAAELPGLEVLRERRKLRLMREKELK
ncbi:hypothetical protein OC846_006132 [Tilletia horrida]|uniref:Uncharacterized protein n=1 Tax=Tilletia horrida TaxID=155126 RepID=A0AAN6JPL5_9BASI|nr:hypothetical protein OC846_006132 [Tilletia horrida]KAK0553857.1 hypothetical protein OC845_000994 [Tilletia horrida]KAK0565390.1 hypothetical protein OC861_003802 [Tilletia horrida]